MSDDQPWAMTANWKDLAAMAAVAVEASAILGVAYWPALWIVVVVAMATALLLVWSAEMEMPRKGDHVSSISVRKGR